MRIRKRPIFQPRIAIRWKPFNSNRTVLRGGYGRVIEIERESFSDDGGTVASADLTGFFGNSIVKETAIYIPIRSRPISLNLDHSPSRWVSPFTFRTPRLMSGT